ncbi:MAG: hypothetical protein RLZZ200_642 [Pseudomonadota bacterium]|jgi:hypothetical protein
MIDPELLAVARKLLHDVNASLQLVTGNLELLDMSAAPDPEQRELIASALEGAGDAVRYVRELQQQLRGS